MTLHKNFLLKKCENERSLMVPGLKSLTRVIKQKLQYAVKRHWLSRLLKKKTAQGGFSTC